MSQTISAHEVVQKGIGEIYAIENALRILYGAYPLTPNGLYVWSGTPMKWGGDVIDAIQLRRGYESIPSAMINTLMCHTHSSRADMIGRLKIHETAVELDSRYHMMLAILEALCRRGWTILSTEVERGNEVIPYTSTMAIVKLYLAPYADSPVRGKLPSDKEYFVEVDDVKHKVTLTENSKPIDTSGTEWTPVQVKTRAALMYKTAKLCDAFRGEHRAPLRDDMELLEACKVSLWVRQTTNRYLFVCRAETETGDTGWKTIDALFLNSVPNAVWHRMMYSLVGVTMSKIIPVLSKYREKILIAAEAINLRSEDVKEYFGNFPALTRRTSTADTLRCLTSHINKGKSTESLASDLALVEIFLENLKEQGKAAKWAGRQTVPESLYSMADGGYASARPRPKNEPLYCLADDLNGQSVCKADTCDEEGYLLPAQGSIAIRPMSSVAASESCSRGGSTRSPQDTNVTKAPRVDVPTTSHESMRKQSAAEAVGSKQGAPTTAAASVKKPWAAYLDDPDSGSDIPIIEPAVIGVSQKSCTQDLSAKEACRKKKAPVTDTAPVKKPWAAYLIDSDGDDEIPATEPVRMSVSQKTCIRVVSELKSILKEREAMKSSESILKYSVRYNKAVSDEFFVRLVVIGDTQSSNYTRPLTTQITRLTSSCDIVTKSTAKELCKLMNSQEMGFTYYSNLVAKLLLITAAGGSTVRSCEEGLIFYMEMFMYIIPDESCTGALSGHRPSLLQRKAREKFPHTVFDHEIGC